MDPSIVYRNNNIDSMHYKAQLFWGKKLRYFHQLTYFIITNVPLV